MAPRVRTARQPGVPTGHRARIPAKAHIEIGPGHASATRSAAGRMARSWATGQRRREEARTAGDTDRRSGRTRPPDPPHRWRSTGCRARVGSEAKRRRRPVGLLGLPGALRDRPGQPDKQGSAQTKDPRTNPSIGNSQKFAPSATGFISPFPPLNRRRRAMSKGLGGDGARRQAQAPPASAQRERMEQVCRGTAGSASGAGDRVCTCTSDRLH